MKSQKIFIFKIILDMKSRKIFGIKPKYKKLNNFGKQPNVKYEKSEDFRY